MVAVKTVFRNGPNRRTLSFIPMKTFLLIMVGTIAMMFLTGCAEVMAIKQPKPYKPTCLTPGTKRVAIIGELGQPVNSEVHTNSITDVYKYVDGGAKNSAASKTVRVIVYVGGDVFTLFLTQIIWIPTEAFGFAGTDHVVTVDYLKAEDESWQANNIDDQVLKGNSTQKQDF